VPLLEVSRQLPLFAQLKICKTIIVLFRSGPDANVTSRSISRSSSRSTRSSKSMSRSSRHHTRLLDDESQRKKLQLQLTEFQNALKIGFCQAGPKLTPPSPSSFFHTPPTYTPQSDLKNFRWIGLPNEHHASGSSLRRGIYHSGVPVRFGAHPQLRACENLFRSAHWLLRVC